MNPAIKMVAPKVVLLTYEKQEDVAQAFMRVQEYYESPEFRGRIFTIGEFRKWYTSQNGTWSYLSDWQGFNVPVRMFEPMIRGLFDPLIPQEQEIADIVRHMDENNYVIGTFEGADDDVVPHEMAHALFATDVEYRDQVVELIDTFKIHPYFANLKEHLTQLGYGDNVLLDECHAYMAASEKYLIKMQVKYPADLAAKLRTLLEDKLYGKAS